MSSFATAAAVPRKLKAVMASTTKAFLFMAVSSSIGRAAAA
jgi:hypothetical protein